MDREGSTLLIVCAVLGGLVLLLGAVYAYIYYTQIRPRHRPRHDDRYSRSVLQTTSGNAQGDADDRRFFHPFMILSYANRVKADTV